MALSRQNLVNAASADTFGTGAFASPSFTPRANSIVVAWGFGIEETADVIEGTSLTALDSLSSLLTNRVATVTSPGWGYGISCWTALAGASPSARTMSLDCGTTNVHAYRWFIDDITGFDTITPVAGANVNSDADGDGAASVTLLASPTVDDIVYGAAALGISSGTPSVSPGASFTELMDALSAGWANWHLQFITGVTSTNVPWADLNAGAGTNLGGTLAALIIKNAAAGGGDVLMPQACY